MKIGFLDIPVSKRNHRLNASDDVVKTPVRCRLEVVEEELPVKLRLKLVNEVVFTQDNVLNKGDVEP